MSLFFVFCILELAYVAWQPATLYNDIVWLLNQDACQLRYKSWILSASFAEQFQLQTLILGKTGLGGGLYENSLLCHFWTQLGPTFWPQLVQIWNSFNRILIFNPLKRHLLLPIMWLYDWLTKVKTSKIITFCYFWPKIVKKFSPNFLQMWHF